MEKISLDELRSILKELGHSDEEIDEVIKSKTKGEETPEDEESVETDEEVEVEATPEEDAAGEGEDEQTQLELEPSPVETTSTDGEQPAPVEETPVEDGEVAEELPVEQTPTDELPVEESPLPEGVEEVSPDAPVVDETPTEPVQSGADVQALLGQIEEYKKANDGLQARIDALESALKEAGVLGEGSLQPKEVGVDDGTRVNDYHDDEQTFDDVLNEINRGY